MTGENVKFQIKAIEDLADTIGKIYGKKAKIVVDEDTSEKLVGFTFTEENGNYISDNKFLFFTNDISETAFYKGNIHKNLGKNTSFYDDFISDVVVVNENEEINIGELKSNNNYQIIEILVRNVLKRDFQVKFNLDTLKIDGKFQPNIVEIDYNDSDITDGVQAVDLFKTYLSTELLINEYNTIESEKFAPPDLDELKNLLQTILDESNLPKPYDYPYCYIKLSNGKTYCVQTDSDKKILEDRPIVDISNKMGINTLFRIKYNNNQHIDVLYDNQTKNLSQIAQNFNYLTLVREIGVNKLKAYFDITPYSQFNFTTISVVDINYEIDNFGKVYFTPVITWPCEITIHRTKGSLPEASINFYYRRRSLRADLIDDFVANWDNNDPTQPGYILGKPFYRNSNNNIVMVKKDGSLFTNGTQGYYEFFDSLIRTTIEAYNNESEINQIKAQINSMLTWWNKYSDWIIKCYQFNKNINREEFNNLEEINSSYGTGLYRAVDLLIQDVHKLRTMINKRTDIKIGGSAPSSTELAEENLGLNPYKLWINTSADYGGHGVLYFLQDNRWSPTAAIWADGGIEIESNPITEINYLQRFIPYIKGWKPLVNALHYEIVKDNEEIGGNLPIYLSFNDAFIENVNKDLEYWYYSPVTNTGYGRNGVYIENFDKYIEGKEGQYTRKQYTPNEENPYYTLDQCKWVDTLSTENLTTSTFGWVFPNEQFLGHFNDYWEPTLEQLTSTKITFKDEYDNDVEGSIYEIIQDIFIPDPKDTKEFFNKVYGNVKISSCVPATIFYKVIQNNTKNYVSSATNTMYTEYPILTGEPRIFNDKDGVEAISFINRYPPRWIRKWWRNKRYPYYFYDPSRLPWLYPGLDPLGKARFLSYWRTPGGFFLQFGGMWHATSRGPDEVYVTPLLDPNGVNVIYSYLDPRIPGGNKYYNPARIFWHPYLYHGGILHYLIYNR